MFREFNARRARVAGNCEVCGAATPPSYTARRFCSQRCQKQSYRQRQRSAPDAPNDGPASGDGRPSSDLAPAIQSTAAPSLGPGARVMLRVPLEEVLRGSRGTIEQLDGERALVRFDHHRRPYRVPLAQLARADS